MYVNDKYYAIGLTRKLDSYIFSFIAKMHIFCFYTWNSWFCLPQGAASERMQFNLLDLKFNIIQSVT